MPTLNPAKMARPVHADGRRYVPAIDGLRCLAAFAVISAHVGSLYSPTPHLVAYYGAAAYPALIVFFTISGFLVYRPFARKALDPGAARKRAASGDRSTNFWIYLLRRVLRIFPLYWAVFFTSVALRGGQNLDSLVDWVQAIFLLPFPSPDTLLQGPLGIAMWTLAIELPFYVIVPVVAAGLKAAHRRWFRRRSAFEVQVIGIIAILTFIFCLGLAFGGELAFPVMSLPLGMLMAVLETRQHLARRRYPVIKVLADNWWLCVAGYVACVFLAAKLALDVTGKPGVTDPYDEIRNLYFPIEVAQALFLFIPVAFGTKRSLFVRALAAAPLQMLAPLTYGVYLWHPVVLHYTPDWYGPGFLGWPFPGTTGFGMPTLFMSLGLAVLTFVFVELPASKLRDRIDRWSRGESEGKGIVESSGERSPAGSEATDRSAGNFTELDLEGPVDATADPDGGDRVERPAESDDGSDVEVPDHDRDGGHHDDDHDGDHDPDSDAAPARRKAPRPPSRRPRPTTTQRNAAATAGQQLATPWCQPIDGFRAICAVLAVTGHTFLASSIFPFSGALHVMGILVALFFAISAYVLYQPFIEADVRGLPAQSAGVFYAKRLLRVYPLFAMALTTYLLLLPEVRPDNWWGYARLYLFLQIFGEELSAFKGLPSAWYLCNEVIFYLAMPVMALTAAWWSNRNHRRSPAARLRAHLIIGWAMVIVGPLTRTLLYRFEVPQPTSLPLSHLEFFGFGVVVAAHAVGRRLGVPLPSVLQWLRDRTGLAYALVLIPAIALAVSAAVWGDGTGLWQDGNNEDRFRFFAYLVSIVLLMSAAALGPTKARSNRFLASGWFKPLSALALHVYLWHQLVLSLMNKAVGGLDKVELGPRFTTGLALVLCSVTFTIAWSWLTQPITDYPYQLYRAKVGRSRGRGSEPEPRGSRSGHRSQIHPERRTVRGG